MYTTYETAVATVQRANERLVQEGYITQSECDQANSEVTHLPASEVMTLAMLDNQMEDEERLYKRQVARRQRREAATHREHAKARERVKLRRQRRLARRA
tara:strand:- start:7 stop:306 length:300 start_codon:yes stop_codon:yes gene_type:complete